MVELDVLKSRRAARDQIIQPVERDLNLFSREGVAHGDEALFVLAKPTST